MILKHLREEVLQANLDLVRYDLVTLIWGNVSGISRAQGLVVIKPSGIDY
jgi:L-ribulose-5-phosphate 4-epimerase